MTPLCSIIIPTLNEEQSIRTTLTQIIAHLWLLHIDAEIIVVDDNSKDETVNVVNSMSEIYPEIVCFVRNRDPGLSQSVMYGFEHALSDIFVVTDADGQHPVEMISELYYAITQGADIAIASRYMPGGGIEEGWRLKRRVVSLGATAISRVLFPQVTDPVSGFFAIHRSVLTDDINPQGYKILTEILGKGVYGIIMELPYTFKVRETGTSKLKPKIVMEFCKQIVEICCYDLTLFRILHSQLARFMAVGISGIFVNLLILMAYVNSGGSVVIGGILATSVAIGSNFLLNNYWTFRDCGDKHFLHKFGLFVLTSLGGMAITVWILWWLTSLGLFYVVADLIGVCVAFLWNWGMNRGMTWGER